MFIMFIVRKLSHNSHFQKGPLETLIGSLIGSQVVCQSRACLGRARKTATVVLQPPQLEFMAKDEIMVLSCQVGPFHLMLTQTKSETNCITKKKCSES